MLSLTGLSQYHLTSLSFFYLRQDHYLVPCWLEPTSNHQDLLSLEHAVSTKGLNKRNLAGARLYRKGKMR